MCHLSKQRIWKLEFLIGKNYCDNQRKLDFQRVQNFFKQLFFFTDLYKNEYTKIHGEHLYSLRSYHRLLFFFCIMTSLLEYHDARFRIQIEEIRYSVKNA